jgi:hypothetical protein
MGRLERIPLAGYGFAVPSLMTLVILWLGAGSWAPWAVATFHQGIWLKPAFLFIRDIAALAGFWWCARRYLAKRASEEGTTTAAVCIAAYCLAYSLLGFDLVMALDVSPSMQLGAGRYTKKEVLTFVSASLLIAAAADQVNTGLVAFSDRVLVTTPSRRVSGRAWAAIEAVWALEPSRARTLMIPMLQHLSSSLKTMSIVAIVSDFLTADEPFAIALTGANVETLEAVQVKGRARGVEAPTPEDLELFSWYTDAFLTAVNIIDGNELRMLHRWAPNDVVACTIDVTERFDQTPGPGAGARWATS